MTDTTTTDAPAAPEIDLDDPKTPTTREEAFALVRAWGRSDRDRHNDRTPEDLACSLMMRTAMARAAGRELRRGEEHEEDASEAYYELAHCLTEAIEDTITTLRLMGALEKAERLLGWPHYGCALGGQYRTLEELDAAVEASLAEGAPAHV